MSFSDIIQDVKDGLTLPKAPPPRKSAAVLAAERQSASDFYALTSSLQNFQRDTLAAKEKLTDMRDRKVFPFEKSEFDGQIKRLKEAESRIKVDLDRQFKLLDAGPRSSEVARKRVELGKLSKDYDRVSGALQILLVEIPLIVVATPESSALGGKFNAARLSRAKGTSNGTVGDAAGSEASIVQSASAYFESSSIPQRQMEMSQQMQQQRLMDPSKFKVIDHDVDTAIREEREKEIERMNKDLILVNEMMKDMASIVKDQGKFVEEIHQTAESSHAKAKEGLNQVKQAEASGRNSTCVVS